MEAGIEIILVNKISKDEAAVLLDTRKTLLTNLRYWYVKYPDVKKKFLSQADRTCIDKDLPDGNFMGSIDFGVLDQEGKEISLDARKPFEDAWKEAFNEEQAGDHKFYLLVNGYFEPDPNKDNTITGEVSEVITVTVEQYTKLIEDQKELGFCTERLNNLHKDLKNADQKIYNLMNAEKESRQKADVINELNDRIRKHLFVTARACLITLIAGAAAAFLGFMILFRPFSNDVSASEEYQKLTAELDEKKADSKLLTKENEDLREKNTVLTDENGRLKEKLAEKEDEIFKKNAEIAKLQKQFEEEAGTAEPALPGLPEDTADGRDALTMDPSPLLDLSTRTQLVRKEDASGKTIAFSNYDIFDSGLLIATGHCSDYFSAFSLVMPEGYNAITFDVGHVMDTYLINANVVINVDGTPYELGTDTINYNQSLRHLEVKGLKAKQIVQFNFKTDRWSSEESSYGIVNLQLHKY